MAVDKWQAEDGYSSKVNSPSSVRLCFLLELMSLSVVLLWGEWWTATTETSISRSCTQNEWQLDKNCIEWQWSLMSDTCSGTQTKCLIMELKKLFCKYMYALRNAHLGGGEVHSFSFSILAVQLSCTACVLMLLSVPVTSTLFVASSCTGLHGIIRRWYSPELIIVQCM